MDNGANACTLGRGQLVVHADDIELIAHRQALDAHAHEHVGPHHQRLSRGRHMAQRKLRNHGASDEQDREHGSRGRERQGRQVGGQGEWEYGAHQHGGHDGAGAPHGRCATRGTVQYTRPPRNSHATTGAAAVVAIHVTGDEIQSCGAHQLRCHKQQHGTAAKEDGDEGHLHQHPARASVVVLCDVLKAGTARRSSSTHKHE